MVKWADYVIVGVQFRKEKKHIENLKVMEDLGDKLGNAQIQTRQEVVTFIERNKKFVTAYKKDSNNWKKGDEIQIVVINNIKFLRTDGDNIAEDNLSELPEF